MAPRGSRKTECPLHFSVLAAKCLQRPPGTPPRLIFHRFLIDFLVDFRSLLGRFLVDFCLILDSLFDRFLERLLLLFSLFFSLSLSLHKPPPPFFSTQGGIIQCRSPPKSMANPPPPKPQKSPGTLFHTFPSFPRGGVYPSPYPALEIPSRSYHCV